MVVDGRSELTASDLELAQLLLRLGKPLFLAVNKIDTDKQAAWVNEFHRLGIRRMFPISAEHGRGSDELLDAVFEMLPAGTAVGGGSARGHGAAPGDQGSRSSAIPTSASQLC